MMKKAFAVFTAIILMPSLNAHAWVGGPWSNNNASRSGDDGVYEAIGNMTNGMGIFRWGVKNNPSAGSNLTFAFFDSSFIWYYKGISYLGTSYGTANSALGVVSAIGNGATNGGQATTTVDPDTGTVITVSFGIQGSDPAVASGNIGYCNAAFTAKITSKAPVKRFKGKGQIAFTGTPDTFLSTETLAFTTVPSGTVVNEVTTSTGGESSDFPERGRNSTFVVMGTQVSVNPSF